jgi:hypothetical protein
MYPFYASYLRGKKGASLEPSLPDLDSMMVSPGVAGTHVQPCPRKSVVGCWSFVVGKSLPTAKDQRPTTGFGLREFWDRACSSGG